MPLTPHERSARAIDWVADWSEGTLARSRNDGYHVNSELHKRLRVHARNRASESLLWFHVPDPSDGRYDAVVLLEFDRDDQVAAAWKLLATEVQTAATSSTTQAGRRILKVPVAGEWTQRVPRIDT